MAAPQPGPAHPGHGDGGHAAHEGPVDAPEWDERYAREEGRPLWSGAPNGTLVVEVVDLAPGTVLDVGCGEGGDAIWLAGRGWTVTAVEPSGVALDRARTAAEAAGVAVDWVHAGLLEMAGGRQFDLVSAQYPALRQTGDDAAVAALVGAVAPGGTLLVVHHEVLHDRGHDHDGVQGDGHPEHEFDPDDYVLPDDVAAHLDARADGTWEVEVSETRPRPGPLPPEARHVADVVLRARRTG